MSAPAKNESLKSPKPLEHLSVTEEMTFVENDSIASSNKVNPSADEHLAPFPRTRTLGQRRRERREGRRFDRIDDKNNRTAVKIRAQNIEAYEMMKRGEISLAEASQMALSSLEKRFSAGAQDIKAKRSMRSTRRELDPEVWTSNPRTVERIHKKMPSRHQTDMPPIEAQKKALEQKEPTIKAG